jgi:hypothetical protein
MWSKAVMVVLADRGPGVGDNYNDSNIAWLSLLILVPCRWMDKSVMLLERPALTAIIFYDENDGATKVYN